MKIKLDWPLDSVAETQGIINQFDYVSASIDIVTSEIILEGPQNTLRNFVFGKYTALLQSNPHWVNMYGIPAHDDFCDLIIKN